MMFCKTLSTRMMVFFVVGYCVVLLFFFNLYIMWIVCYMIFGNEGMLYNSCESGFFVSFVIVVVDVVSATSRVKYFMVVEIV